MYRIKDRYSDDSRADSMERMRNQRYAEGTYPSSMDTPKRINKRRPSTPPSALKRNLMFDARDMGREHRDRQVKKKSSKDSTRSYLNLPYYDLSFLLESDYLGIEKEFVALDAVYRFGIKVLDDSGVINRLIRAVRFNYLDLNDLLSVASNNRKMFSNSKEFQTYFTQEMERRLRADFSGLKDSYTQSQRICYKIKEHAQTPNVAQCITKWLVEGNRHGKNERAIRKLKHQLENQYQEHKKIKRKLESDISDILHNRERYVRKCYADTKPKIEVTRNLRRSNEEEKKPSVLSMLGVRKSECSQSEKNKEKAQRSRLSSPSEEKASHFSFAGKEESKLKKVDSDFRNKKIKQREEDIKMNHSYEEFKANKHVENTKNLNMESLKRREEMKRRQEAGGVISNRVANIGIRTPNDVGKRSSRTTYVRMGRRNRKGFWNSIMNNDICTIF